MYSVYAINENEIEIYKDTLLTEENTLISPKLDLIEGNAGTFKFKMPPTNRGYNSMESLTTEIVVKRRGKEIWSGRIISVEEDFWKNKTITCEGELAYLNDTTQPQAEFHDITPYNFLTTLLSVHNSKAKSDKHFQTGAVTVTDPNDSLYRYTNYESTMKDINDKLVSRLGGYIHLRKVDGVRYIDYVAEENRPASSQVIQFGSNLLDFTKSYDSTEFCTVVLPLGARLENEDGTSQSDIEALEAYVTVESVNDGSPYIVNSETVDTFGWIEKVVNWDNVNQPSILLSKGKKYLEEVQFEDMVLEASAVDLGYLNVDAENINLSDKVRVISRPHGLDKFFPVTKISIPLDDPGNTTFTMGTDVKQSLSTKTVSGNSALIEKINNIPTESEILNNAKRNASNIIDAFTTGYITITADDYGSNELFVTDTKISTKEEALTKAERYWRWNLNGLGYYNKNDANYNNPSGLKLALTMDGAIVADFITVGTLTANIIRAGLLKSNSGDSYWDLDKGEFYISSDSSLAGTTVASLKSTVSSTASSLSSEITNRQNADSLISSRITQTSNSILSMVSASSGAYDTTGYTISLVGLGAPSEVGYSASSYSGRYYLNQNNGYIYYSNGSYWSYVKTCSKLSTSLQSQILQNASNITLKVSKGNLSSEISAESGKITISSNRLVINSTNFSLSADGTMTCNNANIKGSITVGGNSNEYGSVSVRNRYNQEIVEISNNGIYVKNTNGEVIGTINNSGISASGAIGAYSFYGSSYGECRIGNLDIFGHVQLFGDSYWCEGKTGSIRYRGEDGGTYGLEFRNGICVGGDGLW